MKNDFLVWFEVPGEPVPQGRPIFSSKTKTARDPDKSRSYKKLVRFYARRSKPPDIFDSALSLEIEIIKSVPQSWSEKRKQEAFAGKLLPTFKSDIDNYAKSIMDGMNGIIYTDDKIICELKVSKRYGPEAKAIVKIKKALF